MLTKEGMALSIYKSMEATFDIAELSEEQRGAIKDSWHQLANTIAEGVVSHITSNMEIFGVTTSGNVTTVVQGNTSVAAGHSHGVNLSGTATNVIFTQNNDGTGRVR